MLSWPLILRTGFGNVFPNGRWDLAATVLIAHAVNTDDWEAVERFARASEPGDLD